MGEGVEVELLRRYELERWIPWVRYAMGEKLPLAIYEWERGILHVRYAVGGMLPLARYEWERWIS